MWCRRVKQWPTLALLVLGPLGRWWWRTRVRWARVPVRLKCTVLGRVALGVMLGRLTLGRGPFWMRLKLAPVKWLVVNLIVRLVLC